MAKARTLEVTVEVARTWDYQSARVGGKIMLELDPGDDAKTEYHKARRWLGAECRAAADDELGRMFAQRKQEDSNLR